MFRWAYIAVAAALLSGCASFAPLATNIAAPAHYASFDAGAPVEAPVFNRARDVSLSAALNRRSFSPPLRRQPDLRAIVVTVVDRRRFLPRRRRR